MEFCDILLKVGFFVILLFLSWKDWKEKRIPDRYAAAVFTLGMARSLMDPDGIVGAAAGIFVVSLPLFLITVWTNGAFGGGDIKLAAAAGCFMGWRACLNGFVYGLMFSAVYALALTAGGKGRKKGQKTLPLGPFLAAGFILVEVFEKEIYLF